MIWKPSMFWDLLWVRTLILLLFAEFQKVISEESRRQILEKEGRLPDYVIACVGGGSNAIGAFSQYVADEEVKLVGVEAAGHGLDTDKHAATMTKGSIGIVD